MKKVLIQLFVIFAFFSQITVAFASPISKECFSCQKIYVEPEQLAVSSEGIFMQLDEEWFHVGTLSSDSSGIFVQDWTLVDYGCPDPENPCRNCGKCIHKSYNICPLCGKPA